MMNKLIDKIVDRTAVEIPGVCQLEYESGESGVEFSNPALEKFVELVVKECLSICDEVQEQYGPYTFTARQHEVKERVKKHFGVDDEIKAHFGVDDE
jgi:hypothetical protein